MTSKIVVNNIEPDAGISTVTVNGNLDVSGIVTATRIVSTIGTFTGDTAISGSLQIADTIQHEGDVNTKIRFPSNDVISFQTNDSERVRIASDGDVGIGTNSPVEKVHIHKPSATGPFLYITNTSTGVSASDGIQIGYDGTNTAVFKNNEPTDLVFYTNGGERLRISSAGYITKPTNPVFHAFGGPSNVATNTDIVFGQERFDIGNGYNTSTGEYTAPVTGYYHFYAQVYRQTTENDSWWGYFLDTGGGYGQISESRLENDYGGDSGRGYSTLQCSIYWYMSAGHKIKCRVGNVGAIHCNNTFSYFCGNLIG